jgi:hypothetical protein
MRKLIILVSFCAALAGVQAKAQPGNINQPHAALSYNAQKSDVGAIIFDSSFFVFDFNIDDSKKREKEIQVLKNDPAFKKLSILDVNGKKDMMVIVHVEAKNLKLLTEKIRSLLATIGVYNVEYNGGMMPLNKFEF